MLPCICIWYHRGGTKKFLAMFYHMFVESTVVYKFTLKMILRRGVTKKFQNDPQRCYQVVPCSAVSLFCMYIYNKNTGPDHM